MGDGVGGQVPLPRSQARAVDGAVEPLAVALFALNIGAAATVDSLIDQISYRGDLYEAGQAPDLRMITIEGILRPTLFLVSIPLAFLSTDLAQAFWLTMLVTPWLSARLARRASP